MLFLPKRQAFCLIFTPPRAYFFCFFCAKNEATYKNTLTHSQMGGSKNYHPNIKIMQLMFVISNKNN